MANNGHLQGLSPAAKHSALMMALEAAGVAVEDMLRDAVQRQRVLNEYEDSQRRRLEASRPPNITKRSAWPRRWTQCALNTACELPPPGRRWNANAICFANGRSARKPNTAGFQRQLQLVHPTPEDSCWKRRRVILPKNQASNRMTNRACFFHLDLSEADINLLSPPPNENKTATVGSPRQGNGRRN